MTSLVRSRAVFNCKRKHANHPAKPTRRIVLGVGSWELGILRCSVLIALSVSPACGKKGPPLAPLVPIPAAVEQIEANRLGSEVFVSLTIPAANVDEHTPADLARVDVYGYTGRSVPPRTRWVELGTLVATVPVASPPPVSDEKPNPPPAADELSDAPRQADAISVRDTLTPDELIQGKLPPIEPRASNQEPRTEAENKNLEPGKTNPGQPLPLKRFYIAVPFNTNGRPGPPGGVAEFPLHPVPDPPPHVAARYSEKAIVLDWEPSGGLIGFLLDRAQPEEPPPFAFDEEGESEPRISAEPQGRVSYTVYREPVPDPLTPPGPSPDAWNEEPPAAVTPIPLSTLTFTDSVELGRRRCYTVRAVRGAGPDARTGDASPAACLTPTDTFAPAAPESLTTVAGEGAINLIWEPNSELDLGGYVVLRGEAPGDTLRPLTKAAVPNAGYRDETVTPGVRYVYAVMAVDNRFPLPNISGESIRVEETAR